MTWTLAADDTLLHCEREPYWEMCECGNDCYTAVCTKCQTELKDCEE